MNGSLKKEVQKRHETNCTEDCAFYLHRVRPRPGDDFNRLSVFQPQYMRDDAGQFVDVMGDIDDAGIHAASDGFDKPDDLTAVALIQPLAGLVQNQKLRIFYQSPGNQDHALYSVGKCTEAGFGIGRHAQLFQPRS